MPSPRGAPEIASTDDTTFPAAPPDLRAGAGRRCGVVHWLRPPPRRVFRPPVQPAPRCQPAEPAAVAVAPIDETAARLHLHSPPRRPTNLERLVEMLSALRTPAGEPLDLTLTTNGSLLARKAAALRAAGLRRLTVSLDALDDAIFQRMNDVGFPVAEVLQGIDTALAAGFGPIKVNMVVKRGVNDHEVLTMAGHFRDRYGPAVTLRFIEFMDVGATNGWRMDDVVPSAQVLKRLQARWPLTSLDPLTPGETAERWAYEDGRGEIGLISSVTQAFCRDCNRARLSTEGQLFMCLFGTHGHDLRAMLRGGADDDTVTSAIAHLWSGRADRYSELRGSAQAPSAGERRVEMHYIGG